MSTLTEHPTVVQFKARQFEDVEQETGPLDAEWLRWIALDAGADDVGFASIDDPALGEEREHILKVFPRTKALVSLVCKMNREPIRSPARSIANLEFHHVGDKTNNVAREIVGALERGGIGAINPSMGFPMEVTQIPRIWVVSHKIVAEAAGMGVMGIHRNIIHPKFGNFVLLGTVLLDREIDGYGAQLDFNPCLECKLCVAACPVGAISPEGAFNFSACYTHNYREFMGGFNDWVENIADSKSGSDYNARVSQDETWSMWQSLSFGANYKAAYCMSVCPAGEDVIGPYLNDKKAFKDQVVSPLREKAETIYVVRGSDAEAHVQKRFPKKTIKHVGNGLRVSSAEAFFSSLGLVFQPGKAKALDATYHFTFTGEETVEGTIVIRDQEVTTELGHVGEPDLRVTADTRTWLRFLAKETSIVTALLTRKVKLKGNPKLLLAFGECFPS